MDVFKELREMNESSGRAYSLLPDGYGTKGKFWGVLDLFKYKDSGDTLTPCYIGTGSTPEGAVAAAKAHLAEVKEAS